jgi:hypothetical protein
LINNAEKSDDNQHKPTSRPIHWYETGSSVAEHFLSLLVEYGGESLREQ